MKPWGTRNGAQRHPKGEPKSTKNRSGAQNDPKLVPGGSIANVDHPLGVICGSPRGPQNWLKNRFLAKMWIPGQRFSRFLLGRVLQPTFSSIFHRFLVEKIMFFSLFFPIFLVFFWTWRPSRNIVIYISKATFLLFYLFICLRKHAPKSRSKNASKKVSKNVVPGTPRGPQNHRKMDQGRPKVCPKSKKMSIFERLFFWWFFGGEKNRKKAKKWSQNWREAHWPVC